MSFTEDDFKDAEKFLDSALEVNDGRKQLRLIVDLLSDKQCDLMIDIIKLINGRIDRHGLIQFLGEIPKENDINPYQLAIMKMRERYLKGKV